MPHYSEPFMKYSRCQEIIIKYTHNENFLSHSHTCSKCSVSCFVSDRFPGQIWATERVSRRFIFVLLSHCVQVSFFCISHTYSAFTELVRTNTKEQYVYSATTCNSDHTFAWGTQATRDSAADRVMRRQPLLNVV